MTREFTFVTTASPTQAGALPDDLDHFLANSFYNRTTIRPLLGPITPQQWQAIQAYPQINSVYISWRERDGVILYTPTPEAGNTIAYEYVSENWCESIGGDPQPQFIADTDVAFLPDRIFEIGLRWRFRKSKGLDYAEDFRTYEMEVQKLMARDGGNGTIDITGRNLYNPLGLPNIPIGNFPG